MRPENSFRGTRSRVRRETRVNSYVATIIGREDHSRRGADLALADFLPSTNNDTVPPLPRPPPA